LQDFQPQTVTSWQSPTRKLTQSYRAINTLHPSSRTTVYLKEPLGWHHAIGFALIAAGAAFVFAGRA
jgi:uncharacterized protein (DUF486 family)